MNRWLSLARFSLLTAAQQAALAAAGLLVVRALSKTEYAQYTIIVGLISAIAVMAEGGVVATVMSVGGRHLDNRREFATILRISERYRALFVLAATVIAMPLMWWLLTGVNNSTSGIALQIVAVTTGAFASSGSTLYASALRLQLQFDFVSFALLCTAATKLAIVTALAISWGDVRALAFIVAATVMTYGIEFVLFRSKLPTRAVQSHYLRSEIRQQLLVNARRVAPTSLFFVAQGQILPVALVAVGNPSAIAEVAALSRYSLAFALVATIVGQQVMPRLARARSAGSVDKLWRIAVSSYTGIGLLGLLALYLLQDQLLWLLGPAYQGLYRELFIVNVAALLSGAIAVLTSLNKARAWLRLAWVQIPLATVWIALSMVFLTPIDATSAALFKTAILGPGLISALLCKWYGRRFEAL